MEGTVQWPLNQAAYSNMAGNEVDWAALAQQWIYMKEKYPGDDTLPAAPPPPNITGADIGAAAAAAADFDEQGEAPMEVERDEDPATYPVYHTNIAHGQSAFGTPDWQQSRNQFNKKKGNWNAWKQNNTNTTQRGQSPTPQRQTLLPIPSLLDPDLLTRSLWVDRYTDNNEPVNRNNYRPKTQPSSGQIDYNSETLDAAKRKTLPAWIREGLEKMEREKQKSAAEREKSTNNPLEANRQRLQENYSVLTELEKPESVLKSKYESESEDEIDNPIDFSNVQPAPKQPDKPLKEDILKYRTRKSRVDALQNTMLLVRTTLTEILLEVTNEEIANIATETIAAIRAKGIGTLNVAGQKGGLLNRGLGLAIYGDSESSSESDDDGNNLKQDSDSRDSLLELKETIHRRKSQFAQKALEIEQQIAKDEERESKWISDGEDGDPIDEKGMKRADNNLSGESSIKHTGEVQHNKTNYKVRGQTAEKRSSRFSDVTHGPVQSIVPPIYEPIVQKSDVKSSKVIPASNQAGSTATTKRYDPPDSDSLSSDGNPTHRSPSSTHKRKEHPRSRYESRSRSRSSDSSERAYDRRRRRREKRSYDRKRKSYDDGDSDEEQYGGRRYRHGSTKRQDSREYRRRSSRRSKSRDSNVSYHSQHSSRH